jgi:hypothetical protein
MAHPLKLSEVLPIEYGGVPTLATEREGMVDAIGVDHGARVRIEC